MNRTMKITNISGLLFLAVMMTVMLTSCGDRPIRESPTMGNIRITADASLTLILDSELAVFQSIYANATIEAVYQPESDVIESFMADSFQTMVVSRKLTEAEENELKAKSYYPRTTKIAYDAVSLISNPGNPDSNLRFDQIGDILQGKISKWSQLNPGSKLGEIIVVFDNNKSGNYRYIKERFLGEKQASGNCYAVNSNTEVLTYVKNKPNAIGIIGVNWISDRDDTTSHRFLRELRVMGIGAEGDTEGAAFTKPYQGYIADGSYPLRREIYIISRETFAGLGTGFASFIAGDVGQRIILKSGLVPATMPVRLVQIKNDF